MRLRKGIQLEIKVTLRKHQQGIESVWNLPLGKYQQGIESVYLELTFGERRISAGDVSQSTG